MAIHVVTGASGAGKSTLVQALADAGHVTSAEVGRQIVQEQVAAGGNAVPWGDAAAFGALLFDRSVAAYDRFAAHPAPVFFDRSFLEPIAYVMRMGGALTDDMKRVLTTRRFATPVFVCAPWPEIYVQDPERRHGMAAALAEYDPLIAAYQDAGYPTIEVPQVSVAARVDFVLSHL